MPLKNNQYSDSELVELLFKNERMETVAIKYILERNKTFVYEWVQSNNGSWDDGSEILNKGMVILINNVRNEKFKNQSSIHTYFVGICKLLFRNILKKQAIHNSRYLELSTIQDSGIISSQVDQYENLQENKMKLMQIYELITDKCKLVLDLWSRGFSMEEIRVNLGYRNKQIVMNKKNTCLKRIIDVLRIRKEQDEKG